MVQYAANVSSAQVNTTSVAEYVLLTPGKRLYLPDPLDGNTSADMGQEGRYPGNYGKYDSVGDLYLPNTRSGN